MNKIKFTEEEDNLLLTLRNKNIPLKDIVTFFPGRTQDSLRARFFNIKQKDNDKWFKQETVAFLDIESSDLKANNGYMLSWSIKYLGGELKHDVITKREIFGGGLDKRILKSVLEELRKVDVIISYYGTGFDIPFLRTRALMQNLEFPVFGSIKHIDLYYQVKSKLKLHRNSLDAACQALGIEGKTPLNISLWQLAKLGDKESLGQVLLHNDGDVIILEQLFEKLEKYGKFTRKSL